MSDSALLFVVLVALDSGGMDASHEQLARWARDRGVVLQPSVNEEQRSVGHATLVIDTPERLAILQSDLASQPFVDTAYTKPPDALP